MAKEKRNKNKQKQTQKAQPRKKKNAEQPRTSSSNLICIVDMALFALMIAVMYSFRYHSGIYRSPGTDDEAPVMTLIAVFCILVILSRVFLSRLWLVPDPSPRDYASAIVSPVCRGIGLVGSIFRHWLEISEDVTDALAFGPKEKKKFTVDEINKIVDETKSDPPDLDREKKLRPSFDRLATPNDIGKMFLINPMMIYLLNVLRDIYETRPDKCPLEVVLVVFMFDYIENEMNINDPKQIRTFIKYIRGRWSDVGNYINLGNVPVGKRIHILLAFAVEECIKHKGAGVDAVDKMFLGNHTLKYSARWIPIEQDDAERVVIDYCELGDGMTECGLVDKGNDKDIYHKQLDARFRDFCAMFKDELKMNGSREHYSGYHIVAAVGICNFILRAAFTYARTREPLHVLVQSKRVRELFFIVETGKHVFDVMKSFIIVICPLIHPNSHQSFLTSGYTEEEVKKLDISYSIAMTPLNGEQISGYDSINFTRSDANMARRKIREETRKTTGKEEFDLNERLLELREVKAGVLKRLKTAKRTLEVAEKREAKREAKEQKTEAVKESARERRKREGREAAEKAKAKREAAEAVG